MIEATLIKSVKHVFSWFKVNYFAETKRKEFRKEKYQDARTWKSMKLVMPFYVPCHASVIYSYCLFISYRLYAVIIHALLYIVMVFSSLILCMASLYMPCVMFMLKSSNYSLPLSSLKDWKEFRLLCFHSELSTRSIQLTQVD